jgi:hypothetical protein
LSFCHRFKLIAGFYSGWNANLQKLTSLDSQVEMIMERKAVVFTHVYMRDSQRFKEA